MNLDFDPLNQTYSSRRYPIYAATGMVNCSNPLAASAGLSVLQKGGNAMDAAVAAATTLTVVEPTSNGLGSDAFALIWSEKNQKLYGLNSSGRAPMLASIDRIKDEGKDVNGRMPIHGWTPVTVPGAPAAWAEINRRFGKLSLSQVVAPAVQCAQEGFPLSPNIAQSWKRAYEAYKRKLEGACFDAWFKTFAPLERSYEAGERVYLPDHAKSLSLIGETNAAAFYTGELARKIDAESRKFGGYLRYEDLDWDSPEALEVGDRGDQVRQLQYMLSIVAQFVREVPSLAVDGIFGPDTRDAVLAFQGYAGLPRTGRADEDTWNRIFDQFAGIESSVLSDPALFPSARSGQTVPSNVRARLTALGYTGGTLSQALRRFQADQGLAQSGQLTAQTAQAVTAAFEALDFAATTRMTQYPGTPLSMGSRDR